VTEAVSVLRDFLEAAEEDPHLGDLGMRVLRRRPPDQGLPLANPEHNVVADASTFRVLHAPEPDTKHGRHALAAAGKDEVHKSREERRRGLGAGSGLVIVLLVGDLELVLGFRPQDPRAAGQ